MSHAPAHSGQNEQAHDGVRQSWTLLAIALAAQILVVLDISVVNTALPTIGHSLNLAGGDLQWAVTAYVMMSGGALLLGGRISDLLSRRRVFLTGLALFTVASLVSGFAESSAQLIGARAVQGLSAALLTPSALSLITTTYTGPQRKTALAFWGAVGSLGVAAGVLVGGAITTWVSWQFIFWVNVPVGLVAFVIGRRVIVKETLPRPARAAFDIPGAVTVLAALTILVYTLGVTATHGWWSAWTVTGLALSAVLMFTFVKLEQRAAKPLFPPHVWKLDTLVSGTAVMLGVTGILVGGVFLISIFMQTVLGYTALGTGVAFLPLALAITAGTIVARHLLGHVSPRTIAAVGLVIAAGAALLLATASADAQYATNLLPGLVGFGLGVGMVFVPVSVTSMTGIPHSHAGVASGFLMTGHEVGAALGVAALSAVASTAGSLATQSGAADAVSAGFVGAAVIAGAFAVFALARMPATHDAAAGAGMHMH